MQKENDFGLSKMMSSTFWAFILSTFIVYASSTPLELNLLPARELEWPRVPKEGSSVSCPTKSSLTPVLLPHSDDCQKFYVCDNGIPHLRTCQLGLHFNSKIQACDYPQNADCKSADPRGKLGEDSDLCPKKTPGSPVLVPDSTDCRKFYICDGGTAHHKTCQAGLHFNEKIQACDYPSNVNCDKGITEEPKGKLGDDSQNTCPAENAVHPVLVPHATDCDKFYICNGGVGHLKTCQAGLHFNPKISACDYPKNVKCDKDEEQDPKGKINDPYSDVCSADTTGRPFFVPHPNDCEKFIICDGGQAYQQNCPRGLHFNPKVGACDFAENGNCGPGSTQSPLGKIIEEQSECPAGKSVLLPHPQQCDTFIMCEKGKAHFQTCPRGLHFNPKAQICDYPANANCKSNVEYAPGVPSPFCPSFDGPSPIFFRHPSVCSIYYLCSHGLAYEFTCPAGLHFNLRKKACDYEMDAKCESGKTAD